MNNESAPSASSVEQWEPGWTLFHHASVVTTQALARDLPVWSAVWADVQTAGRGQAQRAFVSDPGGLYVTAVVPFDGDALGSRGFALAVGMAVREMLLDVGVKLLRLRWPNDLMVGAAKVGGILVEQGSRETLLVGIGLNVANRPWLNDPSLLGVAGRLADTCEEQELSDHAVLVPRLLAAIRGAFLEFSHLRLAGLAVRLDSCWGEPREVILEPAGGLELKNMQGCFLGIDAQGAVRLRTEKGEEVLVPAHHIQRLREAISISE